MKRTTSLASLAAMSFTVLAMAAAQAQTPDPHHPAPGAPAPMGMPMPGTEGSAPSMSSGMARMMETMQPMMASRGGMGMPFEHVEGRIAFLKAELQITDPQMPAWTPFAETMRTNAAAMKAMHDEMMKGGMPTAMPDKMALRHKMMATGMTMMDHAEGSTKALYAALSPDQQKVFDQVMSGPMGMM